MLLRRTTGAEPDHIVAMRGAPRVRHPRLLRAMRDAGFLKMSVRASDTVQASCVPARPAPSIQLVPDVKAGGGAVRPRGAGGPHGLLSIRDGGICSGCAPSPAGTAARRHAGQPQAHRFGVGNRRLRCLPAYRMPSATCFPRLANSVRHRPRRYGRLSHDPRRPPHRPVRVNDESNRGVGALATAVGDPQTGETISMSSPIPPRPSRRKSARSSSMACCLARGPSRPFWAKALSYASAGSPGSQRGSRSCKKPRAGASDSISAVPLPTYPVRRPRGRVILHKRLTTPHDPSEAALIGLEEIVEMGGIPPRRSREIVHGTTLVTDAIIERTARRSAWSRRLASATSSRWAPSSATTSTISSSSSPALRAAQSPAGGDRAHRSRRRHRDGARREPGARRLGDSWPTASKRWRIASFTPTPIPRTNRPSARSSAGSFRSSGLAVARSRGRAVGVPALRHHLRQRLCPAAHGHLNELFESSPIELLFDGDTHV